MTWTKLSDDFGDDCWELSDAAFRLHVEGLVWSNRKLLNCVIDKGQIQRWAKNPSAAAELVTAGWWTDDGETYTIVHHARYQRDRDAVLAQQKANSANGRKGGRPPARERFTGSGDSDSVSNSHSNSVSDSQTERDGTGKVVKSPLVRKKVVALSVSESVSDANHLRSAESPVAGPPPPLCPRHGTKNTAGACADCRTFREWSQTNAAAVAQAQSDERRRQRELRDNCPRCHGTNTYQVGEGVSAKCDHQQAGEL